MERARVAWPGGRLVSTSWPCATLCAGAATALPPLHVLEQPGLPPIHNGNDIGYLSQRKPAALVIVQPGR